MDTRVVGTRLDRGIFQNLPSRTVVSENLHVIVAITFDRRASPVDVSAFKSALINCPLVQHSLEVSGSFDFMVEAVFPDMSAYNDQFKSIAGRLATIVARHETCFVGRRFVRTRRPDRAIWVPIESGLRRVDCSNVDKVTAEGDYMLIHSAGESWMVHSTLRSIVERFPADDFVQLNRSTIVRYGFLASVMREGRTWFARLDDGTQELIAKSRVAEVLRTLRALTAKRGQCSSKDGEFVDLPQDS